MEQAVVTAVSHDTSEAKVTVTGVPDRPGMAARLFRALADRSVNVDMIVQNTSLHGTTDISFTVPKVDLTTSVEVANELADELGATGVTSDDDVARVSLVGAGMKIAPWRHRHHVRDPGRRRDQHRHDLDLDHPDLVHRADRTGRAGCPFPASRPFEL